MQWNPDCKGPCDCPGTERAEPEQLTLFEAQLSQMTQAINSTAEERASLLQVMCGEHQLVQHRDRKRPWCEHCGRAADGELIGRPRSEPNDGPGPDGHHVVTGECFACLVGVSTGPESHGDRCGFAQRPETD